MIKTAGGRSFSPLFFLLKQDKIFVTIYYNCYWKGGVRFEKGGDV